MSWAPGYAIDVTGMIESNSPKINLEITAFATSVVVLAVLFVVLLVIDVLLFMRNK